MCEDEKHCSAVLASPEYDGWLDSIVNDDIAAAMELYNSADTEERERLLHGKFPAFTLNSMNVKGLDRQLSYVSLTRPLPVAVVYGSLSIVRFLMEQGVKIETKDEFGNNAFHSLIQASALHISTEYESKCMETLQALIATLPKDVLETCLLAQDKDGLRPLELAAFRGTFLLQNTMLESELYLSHEEVHGMYKKQYIDITEYETGDYTNQHRREKSPVKLMSIVDFNRISLESTVDAFTKKPMSTWFKLKFLINMPFLFLWCVVRCLFVALFFISNLESERPAETFLNLTSIAQLDRLNITDTLAEVPTMCNENMDSHSRSNFVMVMTLAGISIVNLVVDIFDVLAYLICTPAWIKKPITDVVQQFMFYRLCQFSVSLCVIILAGAHYSNIYDIYIPLQLEHILYVIASTGCIWSLLYFVQIVPWLGYYVIAIQRMILAFTQFSILFLLFMISYVYVFRRILMTVDGHCPKEFSNAFDAFYSTFLVMQNMLFLGDYEVVNEWSMYILHIIYVFLVAVLLVNFLIAIMSDEYTDVADNKKVISAVQMLAVLEQLEYRLSWLLSPVYRFLRRKHFYCKDGRIYLVKIVRRKKKNTEYTSSKLD